MPSLESILLKVFIVVIVVCAVIIAFLVVPRFLPSPATITPSSHVVDSGQQVSIGVGWKGGSAPYTVTLYSSSNSGCSSSSTVASEKKDLSQSQYVFTVAPTSTTRYCGAVSSSSKSSAISPSVVVTVNPALGIPTLVLSPSAIDTGQSSTVIALVTAKGGSSPYSFTLYNGTSNSCSADTTVVSVIGGKNPITGLAGKTAQFSFAAPAATTFYCVKVLNSGTASVSVTSAAVKFVVNVALIASIPHGVQKIDSGQSVSLTAVAALGTPPYFYQWYTGTQCVQPIAGQNTSSFSPGVLTSTSSFSVAVRDSSPATPAANVCVKNTIAVSPALTGSSVRIGTSVTLDSGQLANLTVSWSKVGTLPYAVILSTASSSSCSGGTPTGLNFTSLANTSVVFSFLPPSTTYYCATVTDSAVPPQSADTSAGAKVTVNPTLSPGVFLSPSAIDAGQTTTLTVRVVVSSGTSPYAVTLYSGSSPTCSADTTLVPSIEPNPQFGLTVPQVTFSVPAPTSPTYYCALVKDSSIVPVSATSPTPQFKVNAALSATISPTSPSVVVGTSISLSAAPSGGTSPYSYQWYAGTGCVASGIIAGRTSQAYSTGALQSTSGYSVLVGDSSPGKPTGNVCASTTVTTTAAFAPTLSLSPQAIDKGQSATVIATVTLTGGTPPYTATLHSGSSSACASDTTVVAVISGLNPLSGITGSSATFSFKAPSSSTYYCVTAVDSAFTPATQSTPTVLFAVTPSPGTVIFAISPSVLDSGQSKTVTATVTWSGGALPYTVTLYSGSSSTCASDPLKVAVIPGSNPQTGLTATAASFTFDSPGSSTYYCATVTDAGIPTFTVSSVTSLFTVNSALSVGTLVLSPSVLDSGQSATVTATITWSRGTPLYTVTLYSGSSPSCTSDTAKVGVIPGSNPQTGLTATSATFTFVSPSSSTYYCASVTDASAVAVTGFSGTSELTVNPDPLVSPGIIVAPLTIDAGQSSTLSTTTPFSGGTPAYTCQWFQMAPGGSTFSGLGASFSCTPSSLPSVSTGTLSAAGTWNFELRVTDSSGAPVTVASNIVTVIVDTTPSVTIAISPGVLDYGQSTTVTAYVAWSGGTSPYAVTLYSGSSSTCSSDTIVVTVLSGTNPITGLAGSTATFTFASPSSTTYYCVGLTDGVETPLRVSSPTILFTVNPVLSNNAPVLSPLVIDSGQSATVTASVSWSGGSSPFTVTLYSGTSQTCSADKTVVAVLSVSNPLTGVTGRTGTFQLASPPSSTYYCTSVTDSSVTPVTVLSSVSQFTVDPPLSANVSLTPPVIDSGQSATVTATVTWYGGTSTYSVSLVSGLSPSCSLDTTPAGSPKTKLITNSTTITFTSPGSTTYYCAKVTDSSSTPFTYTTSSALFMVNAPLVVTITPPSPFIGSGQSTTLTANPSKGTPSYSYQWYAGSGCTATIYGQIAAIYTTGVLSATSTFSVKVTDSSTGTPSSISSVCVSVSVGVGSGPEGVASNSGTGMVYVADPGSNHISVIDSLSNSVVTTITVGTLPWGVAVNPVTNVIYVTNYGSGTVTVINGSTNAVITTIQVGTMPEGIAVNPFLHLAYVADSGSNIVTVINTTTNTVLGGVPVGSRPQSIAIGPSPTYTVFVTNYGSNTISIMDTIYDVTTETVGNNPWGVAVDQLTNRVYVTNSGSGTVTVLDGSTFDLITTITLGGTPEGIADNPATSRAYVSNAYTNTLSEINTATNTVITSTSPLIPITVDTNPSGVTLLLPANLAYVTNSGSNTVSVINILTNVLMTTIIVS